MIGARATVTSINPSDGSPAANACATFYTPVTQMLLRAAHWNTARKQVFLTLLKQLYLSTGQLSTNPPPQPCWYEYAVPADSLKARFILRSCPPNAVSPPLTTGGTPYPVPPLLAGFARFTPALDTDANGNPIKVILTNQNQAQLVYTADISQVPDLWDSQFHIAASASLAAYLVNPLARNAELAKEMVAIAQSSIAAARATDGNESLPTQDHLPDWISIRMTGAGVSPAGWGGPGMDCAGWDSMSFPGGLWF